MGDLGHSQFLAVLAFVGLTVAVVSGEIVSGRLAPIGRRRALFRFHRAISVLALLLATAHGVDRLAAASGGQAALGAVALTGTVVPVAAWAGRRRLPSKWVLSHHAAYMAFAAAVVHATMFHAPGMPAAEAVLYGSSAGAVVALAILREVRAAPGSNVSGAGVAPGS
jgi:hypothetical protein